MNREYIIIIILQMNTTELSFSLPKQGEPPFHFEVDDFLEPEKPPNMFNSPLPSKYYDQEQVVYDTFDQDRRALDRRDYA